MSKTPWVLIQTSKGLPEKDMLRIQKVIERTLSNRQPVQASGKERPERPCAKYVIKFANEMAEAQVSRASSSVGH